MRMPCLMTFINQNGDAFPGVMTEPHNENKIMVHSLEHTIDASTDPHTGQFLARRDHQAVVVCKYLDNTTPHFANAMATGERLRQVVLEYFASGDQHFTQPILSVTFEDVMLVSHGHSALNRRGGEPGVFNDLEYIGFVYDKIVWRDPINGGEAEDRAGGGIHG